MGFIRGNLCGWSSSGGDNHSTYLWERIASVSLVRIIACSGDRIVRANTDGSSNDKPLINTQEWETDAPAASIERCFE